jgi:hypothetical protein
MLRPLTSFAALQKFIQYDPWIADPAVLAEHVWEEDGPDGHRYAFYMLRNGGPFTLGLLLRDNCWRYGRLHANEGIAAREGSVWASQIVSDPETHTLIYGGFDRSRRPWSVRVVRRRADWWELHIAHGGLIPNVSDFLDQESAESAAELWVTDFHEREP